ncbi:MAG: cellulase family glycosylhydrolase [Prevotella sp.]|jgi:endoglucanase
MKRIFFTMLLASALLSSHGQDNPRITAMDLTASELAHYMAPGWNLGNTLEAGNNAHIFTNNGGVESETAWQSTRTTREFINFIKKSGFNSVRLPVSWVMGHITDRSAMTIDEAWLARVKEIVDYCIEANLYVVLNDHWDGGWLEHDGFTTGADVATKKEQLRKLWTNIANAFKDYDQRLLFAGFNEPGVGGASPEASGNLMFDQYAENDKLVGFVSRLQEYEQVFIDAVRATGGNNANRVLVVQGPSTNFARTNKYFDMTKLKDSANQRLMLEVHHYDPYQFCGMSEDADWGSVWYYWAGHAPKRAAKNRIVPDNQRTAIQTEMKNLKANFVDKGYPIILGEYGCNHRAIAPTEGTQIKHDESVKYWYTFSTQYAYEAGLIPYAWDTNNLGRPNMTVFNRSAVSINDAIVHEGIFEGVEAGQTAYNKIYPEPSTTSGVAKVEHKGKAPVTVYDVCGRLVASNVTSFREVSLGKGVYLCKGRKFVVR